MGDLETARENELKTIWMRLRKVQEKRVAVIYNEHSCVVKSVPYMAEVTNG